MEKCLRWQELLATIKSFVITSYFLSKIKNKPCIAFGGDLRVKVNKAGLNTYPDISALCGKELFDDEQKDTLTNPQLIIEVLSDSTEAYDRGKKWRDLQRMKLVSGHYPKQTLMTTYFIYLF